MIAFVIASFTAGMSLSGIFPLSVTELFPEWGGSGVVTAAVVEVDDGWVDLMVLSGVCVVTGILSVVPEVSTKGVEVWNDELEPTLDATVVDGKSMNVQ